MSRILAIVVGTLLLASPSLRADEAQTLLELRELKQLMEQQMKRIDELTVQVGRLHQAVEAHKAALAPGPVPKREVVGPSPFSGFTELRSDAPKAAPLTSETPGTPDPPKAEAVGGAKHTVAKGETLTSIAKLYNISLADLQKANKDVNDRKLQIGRIITVPITKNAEIPPTEKKENP